jgi:hypothetical protein
LQFAGVKQLLQHQIDRGTAGVATGVEVGKPALLGDHAVGFFQQFHNLTAEKVGGVVAQQPVDIVWVDPSPLNQPQPAFHPQLDHLVQQANILPEVQSARRTLASDGIGVVHPTGGGFVRSATGIHAEGVGAGVGNQLNPINSQAQPWGLGAIAHHQRPGPIGEHPAQKFGVKGQGLTGLDGGLELGVLKQARGKLRGNGDRAAFFPSGHLGGSVFKRRHPSTADPLMGGGFEGGQFGEAAVDHAGKARNQQIRPGGGSAEQIDLGGSRLLWPNASRTASAAI